MTTQHKTISKIIQTENYLTVKLRLWIMITISFLPDGINIGAIILMNIVETLPTAGAFIAADINSYNINPKILLNQ